MCAHVNMLVCYGMCVCAHVIVCASRFWCVCLLMFQTLYLSSKNIVSVLGYIMFHVISLTDHDVVSL